MRALAPQAALGRRATPCPSRCRTMRVVRPLAVATPERSAASDKKKSDGALPASAPSRALARAERAMPPARLAFMDEEGQEIRPMPADYGFRSGSGRLYQQDYGTIPKNALELGMDSFRRELRALRRAVRFDELSAVQSEAAARGSTAGPLGRAGAALAQAARRAFARLDVWLEEKNVLNELTQLPCTEAEGLLTPEQQEVLAKVRSLTLDDSRVAAREARRRATSNRPQPNLAIRFTFFSLCWVLDQLYAGRPIERFWVLETVARMPYMVYISMLHLYESLGWWRAGAELRKVHFAEEWNELHHLQIMEALGGDRRWVDRFAGEHAAVFYYWVLIVIYLISPKASYQFMELVEEHAADTYAEFAEQNEAALRGIPPPLVALNYYKSGDLYLFDTFQTSWNAAGELRRPACNTLYDVFCNIRDDELEHVKTMVGCQDGTLAIDLQNTRGMDQVAADQNIAVIPPWSEEEGSDGEAPAKQLPPGGRQ